MFLFQIFENKIKKNKQQKNKKVAIVYYKK